MRFHRRWLVGIVGVLSVVFLTGTVQGGIAPALDGRMSPPTASLPTPPAASIISPQVHMELEGLPPDGKLTVIVRFRDQVHLERLAPARSLDRPARLRSVITTLQDQADRTQAGLQPWLQAAEAAGQVERVVRFWIFNGMSLTATPQAIQALAAHPQVLSIESDQADIVPLGEVGEPDVVEANIELVNAPDLWALGYRGEGMVIASLDTGVDYNHPDLQDTWRGGTNSWLDVHGKYTEPTDQTVGLYAGHGTGVMGVMVGRGAGSPSIGIAPEARWIAVKIFNDQDSATWTNIHTGFQWLLDPDGNPSTPDAPHVVNNSWGKPGCDLNPGIRDDLVALRQAGILPIFAAGNYGIVINGIKHCETGTSTSPANYPEAFAVGAVDNLDQIAGFSSCGAIPPACDGSGSPFPEIVAPGVNIHTTDLNGLYTDRSGTSFSAPHVTAGLALLLQAFPGLTPDEQAAALTATTVDLGDVGPDNTYGYGRLDLAAAYRCLQEGICIHSQLVPRAFLPIIFLDAPDFVLRLFFPYIVADRMD